MLDNSQHGNSQSNNSQPDNSRPAVFQNAYSYLLAVIVALGGFLLGFDGAVNSGAVPFYRVSLGIYDNAFLLGFSSGAIILGSIFGNMIAGVLADHLGRKQALLITGILFAIAALGTALAEHILVFILAKIVAGVGVGIAILIAPVYIAEIAPAAQRGKLISINQLNIVLGIFAAYFSNYFILQWVPNPELNWRWMLGVGFIPATIYFFLLFFIPESPRWLLAKGLKVTAQDILEKLRGKEKAQEELITIISSINASSNLQKNSVKTELSYLFSKPMRKILWISLSLAVFQQLSGINSVLYYAPMVFEGSGVGRENAFLQTIILGGVFVLSTLIGLALIDRLGRRKLLIAGCIIMALSLGSVSLSFFNARYQIDADKIALIENELPDLKSNQEKQHLLLNALNTLVSKQFSSEIEFYSAIKFQMYEESIKQSYSNQSLSNIQIQDLKKVIARDFSDYQSVILKNSITINSLIVLLGLLGFIAGFSISLGPVTWTMLAEIFPNHLRAIGISTAGVLNATTSFVVASLFPWQLDTFGSTISYLLYAIAMVLCLLLVIRFIPETKGKSLEELEDALVVRH
jgi:MFS transporter, SP family, arabinose:H+ symporter